MKYVRTPIEKESPEQLGYNRITYNLSESSVADRPLSDLNVELGNVLLCYGDHRGTPELRSSIANLGQNISANDVLVTSGAAGALFIIATTMLTPVDHLVVMRPNYATNIETPRAIGCDIDFVDLTFETGFQLDLVAVEAAIKPNTKLVFITCPHNPTGVMISEETLHDVIALMERKGCTLLFDETYREMALGEPLPVASGLSPNVISVSSLSKTYGIPGIRIGWLICRDPILMEQFLSAKEQIGISGSTVDERIAIAALSQREDWLVFNNARIKMSFEIVKNWVAQEEHIDWVEPQGGCVCFPKVLPEIDMDKFYRILRAKYGTYVGSGHWFEMSKRHFRIGYEWPTVEELEGDLRGISAAIRDCLA